MELTDEEENLTATNPSWYNRHVTSDSVNHAMHGNAPKKKGAFVDLGVMFGWVVSWLIDFCIAGGMGGYHFDWYGVCLGFHYKSQLGLKFTMMPKLVSNCLLSQFSSLNTRILGIYQHA